MRALLQRVSEASVTIDGVTAGSIGRGLLVLVAVHRNDSKAQIERLARKILHLRIFPDISGKMNLSVQDVKGALLIVSQFTLYADTRKGHRPSFTDAAEPELAKRYYDHFVSFCRQAGLQVETGQFQAEMKVHLVNDGPVTLMCDAES
jgi:D-tyrosyl-tRNA(Tyr) deacylase